MCYGMERLEFIKWLWLNRQFREGTYLNTITKGVSFTMKLKHVASEFICIIFSLVLFSGSALAVRPPLFTDEANTIGKSNGEFEFNGEYAHDSHDGITEKETMLEAKLSYGIGENLDLAIIAPYKFIKITGEEDFSSEGMSDVTLELKWRFFEEHGWAFALRPRITFPTGVEDKDLGAGKMTYSLFVLGTKEVKPWAFHANLGYLRNEHKTPEEAEGGESRKDERDNLWYASLAAQVEVAEHLELVADIGVHTNPDRASDNPPAYILGGLIYGVNKNIDIDFGIKGGLTNTEPDYTLLAGIKLKF